MHSFEGLKSIAGGPWSYYLHPFALFGWRLTDHPQAFIYFHAVRMPRSASPASFFDVAVKKKRKGGMAEKELFHIVQHSLFVALKMNVSRYAMTFFTLLYRGKEKEKENEKKRSRMIRWCGKWGLARSIKQRLHFFDLKLVPPCKRSIKLKRSKFDLCLHLGNF